MDLATLKEQIKNLLEPLQLEMVINGGNYVIMEKKKTSPTIIKQFDFTIYIDDDEIDKAFDEFQGWFLSEYPIRGSI